MRTLNSECWYLLHFLPHGEDGLPHIGVGHLIHIHRLYDLTDAKFPDGIIQTVQRVDAANADKERILRKETGYITLQRTFRQKRTLALGVPCHMHPRIAAGTGWQISAGKPAVFAIGT